MTWLRTTARLIERHEGRVPHAYQDSEGYWTIGVGHLIDQRKGGGLPPHIIDYLLRYDLERVLAQARQLDVWDDLDEVRRAVIVDMIFNLGMNGFLGFRRMRAAMESGDYEEAAREMLDSKWARQVGRRALTLAGMMRTGQWPEWMNERG